MLHLSDLHTGWRSALRSLELSVHAHAADATPGGDPSPEDGDDADREPFHLDDTELAKRLVRDRGLIQYDTPSHPRQAFPDAPKP
jgi:hypothetical protein